MNVNYTNQSNSIPSRITVWLCAALFALSLIPIAMVAPYVRSTGDDLNYSMYVHHVIEGGGSLIEVLRTVCSMVHSTWYSWQGTWSSVALFSLQPGIWGNAWYPLTVPVALLCITVGTWYFLHTILRLLGIRGAGRWSIVFLLGTVMVQYLPNIKCGLFWWVGMAHYVIPYGATMLCMGWSLRWLETGRFRYLIGTILGMSYLGGAGYPEVVQGAVWFMLVILAVLVFGNRLSCAKEKDCATARTLRIRALWLLVPFLLEMVGFAVSAAAPGNKTRGGADFGFSVSRVVSTLAGCVSDGILGTVQDMIRVRVYLPLLVLIVILVYVYADRQQARMQVRYPMLWTLAGLCIICIIRAPERYAGTDVSGGVPDSYWMISLTILSVLAAVWTIWCKERVAGQTSPARLLQWLQRESSALLVIVVLLCLCAVGYRHLIGGSVDYVCMEFRNSGALADYHTQMAEWLDLLEDSTLDKVVLPMMNDQQGPFMLMPPLEEDGNWSNWVYEQYYGKTSVVCVPRETYSIEMNDQ